MRRTRNILPRYFLAALPALLVASAQAFGAWHGPVGPYHDWFVRQMQEPPDGGPCCGDEEHFGGDGRYVDVRSRPDGQYEVFIREEGAWVVYPKSVNPAYANPTGQNVAWYVAYKVPDPSGVARWDVRWFCLRLAQGM